MKLLCRGSVLPTLLLLPTWLALGAAPALAASTTIVFDFTGSQVSILGGIISVPPDGTVEPRLTPIEVPGAPDAIEEGAATIANYGLSVLVDALVQGQASVQGPAVVEQSGVDDGSLTLSGGDGLLSVPSAVFDVFADITCDALVAGACDPIGDIQEGPAQVILPIDLVIEDIGVIGGASILQQLQIELGGVPADVTLIGQEVSRVPEPGSLALLGLGVALAWGRGRQA